MKHPFLKSPQSWRVLAVRWAALLSAALFWLSACAVPGEADPAQVDPTVPAVTLNVMAAASLTGAFEELGAQFEKGHPGVRVQFNFGGSQQLAQQLVQGAPVDVFASANQKQMEAVITAGRVEAGTARPFAFNRLVVVIPKENPAGLRGLADLARPGLKLVFAAPEVPVGQYSLDFLAKASAAGTWGADYGARVQANIVSYEESVKSVLTKVALGEADAGIVYVSDITGPQAARVWRMEIPDDLNVVAAYPMAPIRDSAHPALAQAFVDWVLSEEGQAVLMKWGFIPVSQ